MPSALADHRTGQSGDTMGALFAHAPVLLVALSAEGRIERASAEFCGLLGLCDTDLRGRMLTDIMTEQHAEDFRDHILPELCYAQVVRGAEISVKDARGGVVPLRLSAFAEPSPAGGAARFLAFLEDQRETRAALDALDQKAEEAQEASEAKSRFLAAMSHEVRTPMNAIMGFAQLLQMTDLDDTRRGHVEAILSAGKAMMGLLTDLLDLSQVEAGKMRIDARVFEVRAMLAELDRWWRGNAAQKGLTFSVTVADDVPEQIVSDVGRIQQVLNNYLANAVKFTPQGRVELHAGVLWADGDTLTLRFRVTDSGPGIAPEHVARLYRPFVRIEGEGRGPRTGWGLGLSICANIAEAMGADVGVESEAGQGATFWFDVPVQVAPSQVAATPVQNDVPSVPRRVLLVEDNALNQEVMRRIIEEMGHSVTQVTNGFAALEALEADSFDVVIMDIMMPGLGGVATTKRLREADHAQSGIPIVACSAHVSEEDEARYREIGMTVFLPKPIDRRELARAIEDAISHQSGNAASN